MSGLAQADLPSPGGRTGWPWTEASPQKPVGKHLPNVTIVTPSYNQGRFLEETLRSVLVQGYSNLEYIVMDGGSTDESVEILERYGGMLSHWESHPDGGQSDAINRGFELAGGEIVAWVNSDDLLSPGAVAASVAALEAAPGAGFSYGDWSTIDADSRVLNHHSPPDVTTSGLLERLQSFVAQPTLFFRRDALREVGMLDPDLHLIMDFDLLLRLTARFDGARASGEIARFRLHPEAKTPTMQARAWKERGRVVHRFLKGRARPRPDGRQDERRVLAAYHRQAALYGLRSGRPLWTVGHALRSLAHHPAQLVEPRLWASALARRRARMRDQAGDSGGELTGGGHG